MEPTTCRKCSAAITDVCSPSLVAPEGASVGTGYPSKTVSGAHICAPCLVAARADAAAAASVEAKVEAKDKHRAHQTAQRTRFADRGAAPTRKAPAKRRISSRRGSRIEQMQALIDVGAHPWGDDD